MPPLFHGLPDEIRQQRADSCCEQSEREAMERDRGFRAYQHQPVIPEPTQEELDQRRDDFIKLRVSRTESNLRYWLYLDKNKQYFEQKLYL